MIRQRGLAAIAVYALIALGGLVALAGWWEYHNYTVRKAERAKWEQKLTACENATATAVEANRTLQASADALVAKLREQNERIEQLQRAEAAARKAKQAALAAALAKERSLRVEMNRLTVLAAAPAVPTSIEVCDEARDILRGLAASRVQ